MDLNYDPEDMNDFDRRLFETTKFVGKLLIAGLVFRLVILVLPTTFYIQSAFASLMTFLLSVGGLEVYHEGIRIFTQTSTYTIIQDCLGWKSMAAFLGLMWASTRRTVENLNFILLGLAILFSGNIARVFSTIYFAEIGVVSYELIHGVLWRWSLTLVVLGIWAFWLKNRREEAKFDQRIREQVEEMASK